MPIIPKSNHPNAVRRPTTEGNPSISTFVSQQKQTYVRRYVMPKNQRQVWLENHMPDKVLAVLAPSRKQIRVIKRGNKPTEKEINVKFFVAVFIALLFLTLVFVIAHVVSSTLIIRDVQINGTSRYSSDEIIAASELQLNDSLPIFSTSDAEANVLLSLPYIKKCNIIVELPDIVTFEIVEDTAVAYTNVSGAYFAFNDTMRVLECSEDSGRFSELLYVKLPRVIKMVVGDNIQLANNVSTDFIRDFISNLQESDFAGRVNEINFTNKYDITLSVDGYYNILIGTPEKIELKLAVATEMINETASKYQGYNTVDVRILKLAGIRPS